MSTSEVLDDSAKSDWNLGIQKHADLDGCQHCDKILKSVFESSRN